MAGRVHSAMLTYLFFINIQFTNCIQNDFSLSSVPSKEFDYYLFGDMVDTCSPCLCSPSDNQNMDIICFVNDISNWFTDPNSDFNPPGDFKYLTIFEVRPKDTIVAVDLPAYAFQRFHSIGETLDKLHFHGVTFGSTDEHAFRNFTLKFLLIDSATLAKGFRSFWSLIVAIHALQGSLIELHIVGVEIQDQSVYGTTFDLPPFQNFSALTTIEFEHVPIKCLEKNTFYNLTSLKHLSFSGCPLVTVSSDAFIDVPVLVALRIAASQLTTLPGFLYNVNLANLRVLSLNNSFISDFEDFAFLRTFSNHGLRFLDIRNNQIKTISAHALDNLNASYAMNLGALYLWNNPFHCDCDLTPFAHWLQSADGKIDVTFQSSLTSLTPIEEIFGRDTHDCIPTANCTVVHKETRLQNSISMCRSPVGLEEVSLFTLNDTMCKVAVPRVSYNNPNSSNTSMYSSSFQLQRVIILSLAVFLLFAILLVLLVVPIMKVARLIPYLKSNPFLFDVYISHHCDNVQLVIDKFIPRLEAKPNNLKLRPEFINSQDIHSDTADFLREVFKTSRLTLFLIDNGFINSAKCMMELNTAAASLCNPLFPDHEKQRGIILLLLDNTPTPVMSNRLKRLGKKIAYLRWSGGFEDGDSDEEQRRWEKLGATLRRMNANLDVMSMWDV